MNLFRRSAGKQNFAIVVATPSLDELAAVIQSARQRLSQVKTKVDIAEQELDAARREFVAKCDELELFDETDDGTEVDQ